MTIYYLILIFDICIEYIRYQEKNDFFGLDIHHIN